MTDRYQTRRDYLRQLGNLSVVPLAANADEGRTDISTLPDVTATELVIPEREAPAGFQTAAEPSDPPILSTLQSVTNVVTPVDTAVRGYWMGRDEDNPRWVLSSIAIVTDQPIARQDVETTGSRVYDEFVSEYDVETPSYIDFDQSQTQHATMTDWRMDMVSSASNSATSTSSTEVLLTDIMRLEHHENVLLGTVVFGPDAADRDVETMLTRYAHLQRSRLPTHSTQS